MRNKLYYILWLLAVLFMASCEDLEDTYDEFAGDGKIRYVGKCSDMEVAPGWERLRVTWRDNLDATVKRVKITWQSEKDTKPFVRYIDRKDGEVNTGTMDTVYLEGLQDAVYSVRVSNLSADSTESIVVEKYGRPYTKAHEDLRTFTQGIVNFYPMKDRLAVILDEDNDNLKELILHYWGTDEQQHEWNIKEHMSAEIKAPYGTYGRDYMFLIPDVDGLGIDFSKPLTVTRKGRLTSCIDEIEFDEMPLALGERVWSPGFSSWMRNTYGPAWESEVDRITTVKLDYDITSFQDLLYFTRLEKVILGENRYMLPGHTTENRSTTDEYKGWVTLQFLRDVYGVEAIRYNGLADPMGAYYGHYFFNTVNVSGSDLSYEWVLQDAGKIDGSWMTGTPPLLTEKGECENLQYMKEVVPLNMDEWKVTCSDTTYNGNKKNGAGLLLDDDPMTCFEPGLTLGAKVFEVKFDMQELKVLQGFKVVQPDPSTMSSSQDIEEELSWLLSSIKIELSEDGYIWKNATYEDGTVTIGNSFGETTMIVIPEELRRPVRYVRLTMSNRHTKEVDNGTALFSLRLGDFVPFSEYK